MRRTLITLGLIAIALPAWAQQDWITTFIGGGPNDIPATQADTNDPTQVSLDSAGNYYIAACAANRVYKVDTTGTVFVVAGLGPPGYAGDGVPGGAGNALLNCPSGVAVDSAGNVYIAEYYNYTIRKVDTGGTITTIAGVQGACGYNGDGSPATNFEVCHPDGIVVDNSGNLYIADTSNNRVRKLVLSTKTISTYAGTGVGGYNNDNIAATTAVTAGPAVISRTVEVSGRIPGYASVGVSSVETACETMQHSQMAARIQLVSSAGCGAAERRSPVEITRGVADHTGIREGAIEASGEVIEHGLVAASIDLIYDSYTGGATQNRGSIEVPSRVPDYTGLRVSAVRPGEAVQNGLLPAGSDFIYDAHA